MKVAESGASAVPWWYENRLQLLLGATALVVVGLFVFDHFKTLPSPSGHATNSCQDYLTWYSAAPQDQNASDLSDAVSEANAAAHGDPASWSDLARVLGIVQNRSSQVDAAAGNGDLGGLNGIHLPSDPKGEANVLKQCTQLSQHAQQQLQNVGPRFVSAPSSLTPGTTASMSAWWGIGESCDLEVYLPDGTLSQASGLGEQTVDSSNRARWLWTVDEGSPGTADLLLTCGANAAIQAVPFL